MKALIMLLAASIASAQPAFIITISAVRTVVAAQSPVEVQVILKNTSSHDLRFYVDKSAKAELSGFGAEVTDAQGLVPKITAYYNQLIGDKAPRESVANPHAQFVIVSSGGDPTTAPGGTIGLHMDIAQMYDLSKPGTYTVQVTYMTIKSNPLQITVME